MMTPTIFDREGEDADETSVTTRAYPVFTNNPGMFVATWECMEFAYKM
jgi:hypothetical protein